MFTLKYYRCKLSLSRFLALLLGFLPLLATSAAGQYRVVNLIANERNLGHSIPRPGHIDSHLANGWGLAYLPTSPIWVTAELNGVATIYTADGTIRPLVVTVPTSASDPLPPGCPTGIVANPYGGFTISKGGKSGSALFIFATLDGTISGWNPGVDLTNAVIAVDNFPTSAYTGLDVLKDSSGTFIYAANVAMNRIEKYDSNFKLVKTFQDLNQFFGVYGVHALQGKIYVTFAPVVGKPGAGAVDVFDTNGNLITTLIPTVPDGALNVPWGIAIAPANFGKFSNALLVGNLQDGRINAFDPNKGTFLGPLSTEDGKAIEIPGLWSIAFGGGNPNNGNTNELFFVAGPEGYLDGMFGKIVVAKDE